MPPGPVFRFGELFAGGGGGGGLLFAVLAAVDLVAGRAVLLLESARRTSALGAEGADITGAGVTDGAASGVAFGGDVVKLLSSLPDDGHIVVSLFTRTGPVQDGQFLLSGFENVRKKMAAACKWPHAVARPGR